MIRKGEYLTGSKISKLDNRYNFDTRDQVESLRNGAQCLLDNLHYKTSKDNDAPQGVERVSTVLKGMIEHFDQERDHAILGKISAAVGSKKHY